MYRSRSSAEADSAPPVRPGKEREALAPPAFAFAPSRRRPDTEKFSAKSFRAVNFLRTQPFGDP
jgi:hypothetical protein